MSIFIGQQKKIPLEEPTAIDGKNNPQNAIDGNKDTYFALQGGTTRKKEPINGYWQAAFPIKGTRVSRVEVTSPGKE